MVIGWSLLIWARAVGSWVTGSTMMDNFWDGMSNFISTDPGMLMMECWSIPVATYSEVNGTRVPTNPVYWVARRTFPLMVTDGAMERALMVASPVREAVTGARTSTMTGNPMSEANIISRTHPSSSLALAPPSLSTPRSPSTSPQSRLCWLPTWDSQSLLRSVLQSPLP